MDCSFYVNCLLVGMKKSIFKCVRRSLNRKVWVLGQCSWGFIFLFYQWEMSYKFIAWAVMFVRLEQWLGKSSKIKYVRSHPVPFAKLFPLISVGAEIHPGCLRWWFTLSRVEFATAINLCIGFAWDGVNFLHTSWYGAVFGICAEKSVDNSSLV